MHRRAALALTGASDADMIPLQCGSAFKKAF